MAFRTLPLAFLLFLLPVIITQPEETDNFIYNGFNQTQKAPSLALEEASIIKPTGQLRLTNRSNHVIGHAFYPTPIHFFDQNLASSQQKASSFSTSFVFAIVPHSTSRGGHGLAFTLSPSTKFPSAMADHFLGIFNSSNDGDPSNHIFAVEFDTVNGHNEPLDRMGNHVGININGLYSNVSEPASYYVNGTNRKEDIDLESGQAIQAWIEYDGGTKQVNVTICPIDQPKPVRPLISVPIDLTPCVKETMFVGFSASTGRKTSSHYILGWSFSKTRQAPLLNLSQLPKPPKEKNPSSIEQPIIALITALSSVTVLLFAILCLFAIRNRILQFERLEKWELDCPHRFRYKDLYAATKGFGDSEIVGVGGFGTVYKGVLRSSNASDLIAVKKITRNSIQGVREFAAEIESLGKLRHKNLVHLQGWCKRKKDLLIVYDYIPNGSLDSLLFDSKEGFGLTWEARYKIVKGIASGLLYLHEEWEQVVIHRDVKPSNVLIDAEMNARLGDFGLARLYDHDALSHTTKVVGTIGYIAPELVRTGKASRSSDVFAFGVLLLELATGKRPMGLDQFILVDWVTVLQQMGKIVDAADPELNSNYVLEEMELVLKLGLMCSHDKPEFRPSMRQVTRYLNGDDWLPWTNRGIDSCSCRSSSIGSISTSSIEAGR